MKKILTLCIIIFLLTQISVASVSVEKTKKINQAKSQFESDKTDVKEWTFMFYCSFDLDKFDESMNETIRRLQNLAIKIPIVSNPKINIVFLIDAADAFLGYYAPTNSELINKFVKIEEYDELNLGNYTVLRDFIIRCKNDFPAERYFLHGFGHGGGWRGAFPDEYYKGKGDEADMLSMKEIHDALDESGGVDIISFCSCLMGCIESCYELRNCTDVFIGSEEIQANLMDPVISLKNIIKVLNKNPELSTIDISKEVIKGYQKNYKYFYTIGNFATHLNWIGIAIDEKDWEYIFRVPKAFTMSAIKSDSLNNLGIAIDHFAELSMENIEELKPIIIQAREESEDFPHSLLTVGDPLPMGFHIDLYDFAQILSKYASEISNHDLSNSLENIMNCVDEAVISELHQIGHKNSNGLALFFPPDDLSNYPEIFKPFNLDNYCNKSLEFRDNTRWDEFLELYLN